MSSEGPTDERAVNVSLMPFHKISENWWSSSQIWFHLCSFLSPFHLQACPVKRQRGTHGDVLLPVSPPCSPTSDCILITYKSMLIRENKTSAHIDFVSIFFSRSAAPWKFEVYLKKKKTKLYLISNFWLKSLLGTTDNYRVLKYVGKKNVVQESQKMRNNCDNGGEQTSRINTKQP